ncbi:ABC transporter substrate-binding protein [Sphingobium sp. C100]|uniref:substrate-binding periplasmic protein n=1 Tax=Sphingobium sp. C100 TaxID=1207055 RepID=UPI0003D5C57A|nr:transporter substrate-binding domain-containing protein [Sphingobium sp. C100]ETI61050.1 ABC transporter substrate-binding protein [Sphingobium sp. C100]PHQ63481.1 MAG: ABC transporter substrate-binding protein [Sphingobium sp.]
MFSRRAMLRGAGAMALGGALPALAPAAPLAKVRDLGVLRVAVYGDNRPWSWEKDGTLVGIDVDLAKALAGKLGVRADLAQITADESVDDDLRNAVWKGGLLGFMPADIMLHVPFDRAFAARNDQVAIVAPYYRETFQFACANGDIDCDAPPVQWKGRRLAAELDSIPDFYLIGAFGGALAKDVTHYRSGAAAVDAMIDGEADGVLASRAQIEAVLHERGATDVRRRRMPLPAFTSPGWDIGLAVKENSRTLGDAAEDIIAAMTASGEMQALFDAHGVRYEKPAAG